MEHYSLPVYDLQSIGFVAGTVPAVVTATVPDQMVGVIVSAKYTLGVQSGTVVGVLAQRRLGTITGTLDVVTLSPSSANFPVAYGVRDSIAAVVDPGHEVIAYTTTPGTITGVILFGYAPGRRRRR
ncbi:MAG: hypothetical protein QXP81_09845 [Nitrososphaerota archaeon]